MTDRDERGRSVADLLPDLDIPKAKRYSRTQLAMLLASTIWSVARLGAFAVSGRSGRLRRALDRALPNRQAGALAYLTLTTAFSWLSALPVADVTGHRVERQFGLTKQTMGGWFRDQVKGLGLAAAIQVPLTAGVFAVIRRRPRDWWVIVAGVAVPLSIVASTLVPVLILPIFNRFEPLRDRDLAERIKRLAERAGVPIADVYQMDMSRQSEKPNAFFTGLGRSKRIVLGDTLIDRFEPAEIEGVVAHELGHQIHGDIWKMIAFSGTVGAAAAWMLSRIAPPLVRRTARRTGVERLGDEASLPVLSLCLVLLGFLLAPLQGAFSRAIERRTDRFALELTGDGDAYAAAMARLAAASLADPDPSPPVVFFLYSHPPIAERVATARAFAMESSAEERGAIDGATMR